MAFEFIDGFDQYSTSVNATLKWNAGIGSLVAWAAGARFSYGGMANPDTDTNGGLRRPISVQTNRTVGFWLRIDGTITAGIICKILDAGTNQLELRIDTGGHLIVSRNGTVLGTSSNTIVNATGYLIEWSSTIGNPAVGVYVVRVNGGAYTSPTIFLNGTGNTQNTTNNTSNQVQINGGIGSTNTWFDDFYVKNDLANLGDWRIFTNMPTGDGATTNWTPSTGTSHFANVDESDPNGDTDYNSSATVGQIDLYTFPTVSVTGSILVVQATLTARKDDTGLRQICEECYSGGANHDGAHTFTMNSSYQMYSEIHETDPATSAAWTVGGLNAAQFGAKVIA